MKMEIDAHRCSGHGRCYVIAPDLFTDDDAGYGQVVGEGQVDEANHAGAERAAAGCPEQAIHIDRDS